MLKESSKGVSFFPTSLQFLRSKQLSLAKTYHSKLHFKRMFDFQRPTDN